MIIGFGNDLCDIRRIEEALERFGERFVQPLLHRDRAPQIRRPGRARGLLCQAFRRQGGLRQGAWHGTERWRRWRDMGVVNLPSGKPTMKLTGGAAARLATLDAAGHPRGAASDAHRRISLAQAQVLIEALKIGRGLTPPELATYEV